MPGEVCGRRGGAADGYVLEHGLGHEHVHLAAEAPGGRVLHQHVRAAFAVRRVQEVVPGLTIVLLYGGKGDTDARARAAPPPPPPAHGLPARPGPPRRKLPG